MEQPGGQIWVRCFEKSVCIRVQGRATHLHATPLQTFARDKMSQGHASFEIDLGRCTSMDSTFLGVLVGLSMKLEREGRSKPTLTHAAPRTLELFKTLGVERFFELGCETALVEPSDRLQFNTLATPEPSRSEWAMTVMNAHQLLCEVDDSNGPRFQDLLEYLKRDLQQHESVPAPKSSPPSRWSH